MDVCVYSRRYSDGGGWYRSMDMSAAVGGVKTGHDRRIQPAESLFLLLVDNNYCVQSRCDNGNNTRKSIRVSWTWPERIYFMVGFKNGVGRITLISYNTCITRRPHLNHVIIICVIYIHTYLSLCSYFFIATKRFQISKWMFSKQNKLYNGPQKYTWAVNLWGSI